MTKDVMLQRVASLITKATAVGRGKLKVFTKFFLMSFIAMTLPVICLAQDADVKYGSEISGHLGTLLPNQIEGITEILPVFGLRYGLPTNAGVFELGFANTHAQGVDFTQFSFDLRTDIPLIEHVYGIFYGGLDYVLYRPVTESERLTATGIDIGSGLMMHITDTLWLRSDMRFGFIPGTSLYIGFGFVLRAKGGGGGD